VKKNGVLVETPQATTNVFLLVEKTRLSDVIARSQGFIVLKF
jgi:hypothetical protein